jgi:DNA-binding beta-propeller fold protein YncE
MMPSTTNSRTRFTLPFLRAILIFVLCTLVPASFADKKEKAPQTAQEETEAAEPKIDTSQLVWPRPPDIARIRWVGQFKGEPAPPPAPASAKKKQKWMDRLAGKRQIDEIKAPHPHILVEPNGVAVDSKGNIYVADTYVGAVFIFNTEVEKVSFIHNGKEVHFEQIIGLAMDDNDRLFISDSHLKTIFVFDAAHRLVGSFGADSLERPSGIALDAKNRLLYVTDVVKNQVAVFDADTFKFQRAIGGPPAKQGDEDPGTFARPTNVAVDGKGDIYVADTINNRIQIFDAEGNFLSMFGRGGDGPGYFGRPKGLAVDRDGHIWVADTSMDRVQVFDRKGQLAGYFGVHGTLPGQFVLPTGVAIDGQNRVMVTEQFKGRLQIFRYITDAEAAEQKTDKSASNAAPSPNAEAKP